MGGHGAAAGRGTLGGKTTVVVISSKVNSSSRGQQVLSSPLLTYLSLSRSHPALFSINLFLLGTSTRRIFPEVQNDLFITTPPAPPNLPIS